MTITYNSFIRAKSEIPWIKPCYLVLTNIIFTCFNYNKPSHITKEYPKPQKRDLKEIKEELEESYNN